MAINRSRLVSSAVLVVVLGTALSSAAPADAAVTSISKYCTACWRNARLPADLWGDCTQEVFVRLLERLPAEAWNDALNQDAQEHRELVRAIDCVKKRVQRAKKAQAFPVEGVVDAGGLAAAARAEETEVLTRAAEALTARQREVLRLWVEGYDVPSIAAELRSTPARISDEKYKAIRRLRELLV